MAFDNTRLSKKAAAPFGNETSFKNEPDTVAPVIEGKSIPDVMEQYRDRVVALPPEAKDELVLSLASDYLSPDEFEMAITDAEESFVGEVPEPALEEPGEELLEEIPEEIPGEMMGEGVAEPMMKSLGTMKKGMRKPARQMI